MRAPGAAAAIQGERGSFSHQAARQVLGEEVGVLPCRTFEELFDAVTTGRAEVGMVPVENTLAGAVQRPMDLLVSRPVRAVAETRVPIRLCLVAPPGTTLEGVRVAASHPVALQQCLRFFRDHPGIRSRAVYDTAGSVRDLMAGDHGGEAEYQAAIASALAAELYGAEILLRGLEDDDANFTRFLAVVREEEGEGVAETWSRPGAVPKTSLAFTLPHTPGALHTALGCFAAAGVDLSRLESRPIPGHPWEYRFYADMRGADVPAQDRALEALVRVAGEVRVVGRYAEEP